MNDHPVIFFDGVCNLCNSSVQFVIKRDRKSIFRFAPLQSSLAEKFLKPDQTSKAEFFSVIVLKNGKIYERSDAVLEIARDLPGLWRIFYIFRIIPKPFRDFLYSVIAKNRYRLFGKRESCMIPTPALKSRFLN